MLVMFRDKERPTVLLEKEYSDILPMLEMIKQKALISLFFDSNGDKRVVGRLYDYEYVIEMEMGSTKESLMVMLDCSDNTVTN